MHEIFIQFLPVFYKQRIQVYKQNCTFNMKIGQSFSHTYLEHIQFE